MARLVVSAVSRESKGDTKNQLLIFVSVSRADDGSPVTGLDASNFRITSNVSLVVDPVVSSAHEGKWEPGDSEPSGCYAIGIFRSDGWGPGQNYTFGVQARTFAGKGRGRTVVDQGQTALAVLSTGT
jgi:hypothetical protein